MSHSALAVQWEGETSIREKARQLQLATCQHTHVFFLPALPHICNMYLSTSVPMSCIPNMYGLPEVTLPGGSPDRDAVKANMDILRKAVVALGLRVGVKLCVMHVAALYEYMQVPCPGDFGYMINCTSLMNNLIWFHFYLAYRKQSTKPQTLIGRDWDCISFAMIQISKDWWVKHKDGN